MKNKAALIRYKMLDECFNRRLKWYSIEELLRQVNENLEIEYGFSCIKKRQLYDDIAFMETEWNIPLEKKRDGKTVRYHYSKPFSIQTSLNPIIEPDVNDYLKGITYVKELEYFIKQKTVLAIDYKPYSLENINTIISPYYLKQYNRRWFLLGWNHEFGDLQTMAVDRIEHIELSTEKFIPNTDYDFEEYFEDVVGVTVPYGKEAIKIRISVVASAAPYILTKPLHGSQRVISKDDEVVIEIDVIPNVELKQLLLSQGANIEILSPAEYRDELAKEIKKMNQRYGKRREK